MQPDSDAHYASLMQLLASQTNGSTGEIKDGAVFTPLAGTLGSARSYFADSYGGSQSPIQYSCQKNFVALVTDGLPTGRTDGGLYSDADRTLTPAGSAGYTLGRAYTDTINAVTALRATPRSNTTYDVKTYVVGLGDTVNNPGALYVMDRMAQAGGTGEAYRATNQGAFSTALESIARDIVAQTGAAASVALNTGSISADSRIYQAKFHSGDWTGQLLAIPIQSDGSVGTPPWEAGAVLSSQSYDTGRTILSFKPSTRRGIRFRWPNDPTNLTANELDTSQVSALNKNAAGTIDSYGNQRLEYIRGNSANEGSAGIGFRARPTTRLGDIVNSAPAHVGAPAFGYSDSLESSRYSAFVNSNRNRPGCRA